jgi:hypothetical protein
VQCGPPGWRGEFHEARDPADRTVGRDPSRPTRPSVGTERGRGAATPVSIVGRQVDCTALHAELASWMSPAFLPPAQWDVANGHCGDAESPAVTMCTRIPRFHLCALHNRLPRMA